jgi:hypothetical protein
LEFSKSIEVLYLYYPFEGKSGSLGEGILAENQNPVGSYHPRDFDT